MIIWGYSAGAHDAALTVYRDEEIVFASTADRFSGELHDPNLNANIVSYALNWGEPDCVTYYEEPWHRWTRQLRAGQFRDISHPFFPKLHLESIKQLNYRHFYYTDHQLSHASAYYHSGYTDAAVIVLDSVGQWASASVWLARGTKLKKQWAMNYPNSIGLFYSAITQRCGLEHNAEELALMGLAATGDYRKYYDLLKQELISWKRYPKPKIKLKINMHRGITWWRSDITDVENLAAAAQKIYEEILFDIALYARGISNTKNLVIAGDCARNSAANAILARRELFENIYIPPAVGDAGASLGSILAHAKKNIHLPTNCLGYTIEGEYPSEEIVEQLLQGRAVAVANGRAEFGDQTCGNRSILIDPRLVDAREQLNAVKGRRSWETYCPAILEEHLERYFKVSANRSPYSHFNAKALGDRYPAIVHTDGTSKVQTVTADSAPNLHRVLTLWYERTGFPMLVCTGLESGSKPLVNNEIQAQEFANTHNIPVLINKNLTVSPNQLS